MRDGDPPTAAREGLANAGDVTDEIGRGLSLALLALLALVAIQTLFPLLKVGLATNDDLKLANAALDRGLTGFASVLWAFTRRDGRLDITQILSWYLPFAVDSFAYFKAVSLVTIVADLVLFALFARSVFRSSTAFFLTFLLSLVGLQNSWEHSPLVAFPGLFTFTFAYLLGSLLAFQRFLERKDRRWLTLSTVLFLVTLCSYEMYLLYTPIFFGLALLAGRSSRQALRTTAPHLAAVALYLAAYVASHTLRTGNYLGVTVAPLDIGRIARVVWQFSVSSLPTYFFFSEKYVFLLNSYHKASGISGLLGALTAGSLIKAALVGGLYTFLMLRPSSVRVQLGTRRLVAILAVALVYFFAPSLLPGLSEKYQQEVNLQQLGMQSSYFSLFAWVWLAVPLLLLVSQSGARYWFRWLFTGATGAALVFASLAIDYTNAAVAEWQARGRDEMTLVDEFIATSDYAAIPEGAILYAPSLWTVNGTINFVGTAIDPRPSSDPTYDNYWTFYFSRRGQKRIVVADRLERIPRDAPGFFYLKHVQPGYERSQHLLFAWVERANGSSDVLVSDRVTLYDRSSRTSRTVWGRVAPSDSAVSVELVGGSKSETSDLFAFDVGTRFLPLGNLDRFAVFANRTLIDVESVFLAGSTPVEQRVVKTAGWLLDGWIGTQARATLHPVGTARLVMDVFAPDYIFKAAGIPAVTLTLELDGERIATRQVTEGGRFRIEANVPNIRAELVARCGPLHSPSTAGVNANDIRQLCLVIERVALRKREPGE